jgi:hypothetical protein
MPSEKSRNVCVYILTVIRRADHHHFTERELVVPGVRVSVLQAQVLHAPAPPTARERHAGIDGAGVAGAHRSTSGHVARRTHVHRHVSQL